MVALAAILALAIPAALLADGIDDPDQPAEVVFVCLNGVAMSVWATAYFNRLAADRGLSHRAHARATIPSYRAVPLRMRFALALDGFFLRGFRPRVIDEVDAESAEIVVAIDARLPAEARIPAGVRVEHWQGFPPMRERYHPSRRALRDRVRALVDRLASEEGEIR